MRPSGAPDYRQLMDAETWAFIDRINAFYPPGAIDLPIAENRAIYDRMSRAFHAGHPAGVTAQTGAIEADARAIPMRVYRSGKASDQAVVLYFHGGGFILGGLDSHDDICAELCAGTGYAVVSIDYRLAPEHTGTAAFDDAVASYECAVSSFSRPIVLCGESAGGTLAASLAHHLRGHARAPVGQVLIYPMLGGDERRGSHVVHAQAPLLSADDIAAYKNIRANGADVSNDPRYLPLADTDFSGLPPTVVFTAECDPLSSDGEAYRDRLLQAGGRALWREEKGLPHGYLRARGTVARARASFARIIAAAEMLGGGRWPEWASPAGPRRKTPSTNGRVLAATPKE
ncbi:MAG TPA: alpha/beta hydrolase [Mesorhizobium sp.]|jgi:acetyl esterase|nr:alpha/beta hydrolase [Mesorhizobium sp.]